MFGKKFSSNIRRRKRMITSSLILLVVFLTIGYSVFTTNLSINGTLGVSKYDQTLYGVLEKAAKEGTYAREYTGEHHDSFTVEPTKKIYHWYGSSNDNGTAILDMNNVIFANHCWQMIRTTDTGGVKMVYNGEPENNQCLNTRSNHVGYGTRATQSMSTTYYYGTSYTYDKTNNVFSLDGTVTTGTIQEGQYTCKQTTSTGTCSTLYLVDTLSSGLTYYVLTLNSNSHYSQFGTLQFNQRYDSPSYVGYMYNTVYPYKSEEMTDVEGIYNSMYLSDNSDYWYATSVSWDSYGQGQYRLNSPIQITSGFSRVVGKYTFLESSSSYYDNYVRYIAGKSDNTIYYVGLFGGELITDTNYTYGDSYTDNGNGTYTINNPTTINRINWYTSYSNVGAGKYVCKNVTNNTCSDLWYTTSTSKTSMSYIKVSDVYKYAKGFTWDGSKYILDNDTAVSFWNISDSTNKTSINNAHYTCLNETGECTTISYIYYISGSTLYYINISNGKSVDDAVNEMLYNDDVNQTNSTIKTGIDAWYKQYLSDYSDYLEDTIFCNDRSQSSQSNTGWNPNGGNTSTYMSFYGASDLSCPNDTDKFGVSNNKAQLTYPVALLTYPETYLLNNNNIRKTGQYYWLASPAYFASSYARELRVGTDGSLNNDNVNYSFGVRPAISLTPGTEYTSGSGSMADPYIVEGPMGTLTISYKSETGITLHEPYIETMPVGASYSIPSPTIPGYITPQTLVTGTMSKHGRTTTVTYVEDSDVPPGPVGPGTDV